MVTAGAGAEPLAGLREQLDSRGYAVWPRAAAPAAVRAALRLLYLTIRREGLSAEQIAAWQHETFFPHLRWEPAVWGVLPEAAAELLGWRDGDDWGEPQLLVRFPDEDEPWPLRPHVDTPPPWAGRRGYRGIVGVALTPAGPRDGTVRVWPGSHRSRPAGEPVPVPLRAGDAIVMHPRLAHCGSLNLGSGPRCAVYFRLIAGARRARERAGR